MRFQENITAHKSEAILKKIQDVTILPPIPRVLQEITQLFSDPSISARKIEMLIEKDPSLTVKVLSVANSPLFGLRRSVTNIGSAVLILGYQEIKSIVTSIKMAAALKMKSDKYFDPDIFLNHSLITGILTQRMSKDLGFNFDGDGFTAGMLHDMGIVILHEHFPQEFSQIAEYAAQYKVPFLQAEYNTLGLSHQEIGEFLADKWSLPAVLSDVLQFHHKPGYSKENNFLTSILHLADYATGKFDSERILWDSDYVLDDAAADMLNFLSKDELNDFVEAYREDYLELSKTKLI
ncbi:MAG: HDOD domain-containing protein [Ignavibacteriota bacterium]|nr:HDOD domain-containing protein [Ignavibacteriota bacterium]MCO6448264.1 HDOD domain-containing protein [Ignavibacterium album]MEB2354458.1 HDOD domain-containing protein [Ignavibacteriales bacterium]QKK00265.1 MAG: HDOD domain-containing protein [Ignavibacteriota bacterium]HOJ08437.1 HDOD domain-containing protein [Ignavibacteriaceae bacterium]